MSVTVTGTITPSAPVNGVSAQVFTDTTTGIGTLVSRTLNIYNSDSVLVDTVDMGTSLTATYGISADAYLSFEETIVDNTGTYIGTFNIQTTIFYDITYVNTVAQLGCSCGGESVNYIDISLLFRNAALILAAFGLGSAAQNNITAANTFISGT